MSKLSKSVVGKAMFVAASISLSLGAVQLASGRDLSGVEPTAAPSSTEPGINRSAKADRVLGLPSAVQRSQTVSLRLDGMAATSVLVRIPENTGNEARGHAAPSLTRSGDRKTAIACEPSVSVLTEVAKQLQPGRCVT